MAGAVVEVEPGLPQRPAGEGIELRAAGPPRKDGAGDGDMALEHQRIGVAGLFSGAADGDACG